jgi:hypothetical protein
MLHNQSIAGSMPAQRHPQYLPYSIVFSDFSQSNSGLKKAETWQSHLAFRQF